jgi:hypothetical protein
MNSFFSISSIIWLAILSSPCRPLLTACSSMVLEYFYLFPADRSLRNRAKSGNWHKSRNNIILYPLSSDKTLLIFDFYSTYQKKQRSIIGKKRKYYKISILGLIDMVVTVVSLKWFIILASEVTILFQERKLILPPEMQVLEGRWFFITCIPFSDQLWWACTFWPWFVL